MNCTGWPTLILPTSASAKLESICILREVLRDLEQRGRLEARRHGLPEIDRAVDHDAGHRRADHAVVEVGAVLRELGLGLLDLRLSPTRVPGPPCRAPASRSNPVPTASCCAARWRRPASDLPWRWRGSLRPGATAPSSSAGSSSSSTWPAFTRSLKSTCSFFTVPETCVPTLTSTTGLSVPLADTVCVTSARRRRDGAVLAVGPPRGGELPRGDADRDRDRGDHRP